MISASDRRSSFSDELVTEVGGAPLREVRYVRSI